MFSTESRTAPATTPAPEPPQAIRVDTRTWLQQHIDGRAAIAVGISWFVLTQIAFALEPVSRQPVPAIGVALELAMYALIFTMIAGLALRKRWGLLASLGGALLATAAAIACPLTGHHHFGAWWYGQMACVFALVGISVFALRRNYS